MDKDLKVLFDQLDMAMIQNKSIFLNAIEKKPDSKFIDEDSAEYKNKKQLCLNKLNNEEIKEPKPSTMAFYQIDYDENTGLFLKGVKGSIPYWLVTDSVESNCTKCNITKKVEEFGYTKDNSLYQNCTECRTKRKEQKAKQQKPSPAHEKTVIDLKQLQQDISIYTADNSLYDDCMTSQYTKNDTILKLQTQNKKKKKQQHLALDIHTLKPLTP